MKKLLISAALPILALPCLAQEHAGPWSLQECISYALEHNITVQQSAITVQNKEIDLNTAQNKQLPAVSGGVSQNFSFGRGLTADNTYSNTNTTSTSFSLGADVPIFQGGQIHNGILLAQLDLSAATTDLEKAKDDIRVAVAQAYVQVLYDYEILAVALAQQEIDSLQVERMVQMRASGKASAAEVSAQKSTWMQSKLSATQARGNLTVALLDLSQLLELPSPEGFDIVLPSEDALDLTALRNPEDIYATAVEIKPAVVSDSIRVEYARRNIELAKGGYLPTLSLSGGLGSNFYTASNMESKSFGTQLKDNFSQYIGLSLNVPVFQRFQTRNSVRSAELNLRNQELQLESTRKALYKEIQQAYYNAVTAQSKFLSSQAASISAEESFELVRAKCEAGKASIAEYNESRSQWLSARSNYAQARYEMIYQTKLLDFYEGLDLTF